MQKLKRLKQEAFEAADSRGHFMRNFRHVKHLDGKDAYQSTCRVCKRDIQVMPYPPANGIEIGGTAIALNCNGRGK